MSAWYQDAIIYELHVKTFQDGNGDGIGDFAGLISRLDYLERLGVTCVWLLPFYESPLLDDGYDIAHYERVNPQYGTLEDVRRFIESAHARGIRVITELVINHTSDQHPWFQAARRAPAGSDKRDFYVWSNTDQRYADARIIFGDVERSNWTWDPVAGAYYWHRFFHHQPDLNFDNPHVRTAVLKVMRFWLAMGVDGLRLDAIAHLFEREGTICDNLPETHVFLKEIRADLDARYHDRMLLAEANPGSDELTKYFGDGDECHMAFHFPLMTQFFSALLREDPSALVDVITRTPSLPAGCQWALFLRNHDELALSSVSESEQQMLLDAYAPMPRMRLNGGIRRRLAPLLNHDERAIELAHALLLSLPGSPVIYYGDEIGMADNIELPDRDGVRTAMEWEAVLAQENAEGSLLARIKRLIHLRRELGVFGRGSISFVPSGNPRVLSFVRDLDDRQVLVVANLARSQQECAIQLHSGCHNRTLEPQSCYWIRVSSSV